MTSLKFTSFLLGLILLLSFISCSDNNSDFTGTTSYTITFNSQGADIPASPATITVAAGMSVDNLPTDPIKTGYTFSGWFTNSICTGPVFTSTTSVNNDIILYAKWEITHYYAVTYDPNGANIGTAPVDNKSYTSTQSVTILPNTNNLIKTSFIFTGWNTSNDGSGNSYISGETLNMGTTNLILYAKWEQLTYRYWHGITSSADGSKLVAIDYQESSQGGHIYTSTNFGLTWTARATNRHWWSIAGSSDGTKLAATTWLGHIYTSTDSGLTWTERATNRRWTDITISDNGTKLAATEEYGYIYTSADSGATWFPRETTRTWRSITGSSDGSKLSAAVNSYGQIYTSINSGLTWTENLPKGFWVSIAGSDDGTKLAAIDENGGQIYTSSDSGFTWILRLSSSDLEHITCSSDGSKLAAIGYNSRIYTSTDSGATWTPREKSRHWRAITISDDGTRLAATAGNTGSGFLGSDGFYIYISADSGTNWTPRF